MILKNKRYILLLVNCIISIVKGLSFILVIFSIYVNTIKPLLVSFVHSSHKFILASIESIIPSVLIVPLIFTMIWDTKLCIKYFNILIHSTDKYLLHIKYNIIQLGSMIAYIIILQYMKTVGSCAGISEYFMLDGYELPWHERYGFRIDNYSDISIYIFFVLCVILMIYFSKSYVIKMNIKAPGTPIQHRH